MSTDEKVLNLDSADFTIGEIETIEEIAGMPIGWLGREDKPQGKGLVAVAYVMGLRDNPKYTLEEARTMRIKVEDSEGKSETPKEPSEKSDSAA